MRVVVTVEHRFESTPDGAVWTETTNPYAFWTRYLDVFDEVIVVARIKHVPSVKPQAQRADGDGVRFAPVPYYVGPLDYVKHAWQIVRAVRGAITDEDAVILRLPSQLGNALAPKLWGEGRPYGVEVVGNPNDVFAPSSFSHPLRAFFRYWFSRQLRRQCARATAAAYVTAEILQREFPPSPEAFTAHYSSIELLPEALSDQPRTLALAPPDIKLITVGTLDQLYKAPDIVIEAMAACIRQGLQLHLVLVGDGKHRSELEEQARALGLADRVEFRGRVAAGAEVRKLLDQADLFVLPSRADGLPRAVIEAMARGLPCLGSTVGGFPELLPAEDLVPPGDAQAFANKLCDVLTEPQRLGRMSARNLQKAREYGQAILRERRGTWYKHVRDETEAWLKAKGS